MTDDELSKLEALAGAAFKGPWRYGRFTVECERHEYEDCPGEGRHDVVRVEAPHENPESREEPQAVADVLCDVPGLERFAQANGEFIAAAREAVPRLVAALRAERAAHETARTDLNQLRIDMQQISTEDERGHALIDEADGEEPDTTSADTLADRVERLLAGRDALRAELAKVRDVARALRLVLRLAERWADGVGRSHPDHDIVAAARAELEKL